MKTLPPIQAGLVLMMTSLEIQRDIQGMNFCRDRSIGPLRKKLGKGPVKASAATEEAVEGARTLLAEMCGECPFKPCKMKVW